MCFYLQDEDADLELHDTCDIPLDAEYKNMIQPPKSDIEDIEYETFDRYIGAEFMVNSKGDSVPAKVIKGSQDNDGKLIGKKHSNPLLNSCEYECILDNGTPYLRKLTMKGGDMRSLTTKAIKLLYTLLMGTK
jgi:hypothetical protein